MANTVFTFRANSTAGVVPSAGALQIGEAALNTGDGKLYAKMANSTVIRLNPNAVAGEGISVTSNTTAFVVGMSGSYVGNFTFGDGTAAQVITVDSAANTARLIDFKSGGLARWRVSGGAGNETGSNAGSDILIQSYDDSGVTIENPFRLYRANGTLLLKSLNLTNPLEITEGGTGATTANGATQALLTFTSALKGLTPASGGGTTNFLRADGTWTTPTASAAPAGSNTQVQYNDSGSTGASAAFTFDESTNTVNISNTLLVGSNSSIDAVINSTSVTVNGNQTLPTMGKALALSMNLYMN